MRIIYILLFCVAILPVSAAAQSRGAFVEEISNEQSSFAVRVDVDHADRIYAKDECLTVNVESSEDGFLYLFYKDASGSTNVLFPNRFQSENSVQKKTPISVPQPGSTFRIRMDAPFGEELLKAVVSKRPLADVDLQQFTKSAVTPLNAATQKSFTKSLSRFAIKSGDWAEHQVAIQTVANRFLANTANSSNSNSYNSSNSSGGKRFAVGVGISDFKDSNISNLGICHIDAQKMVDFWVKKGGVAEENTFLLLNENATLSNIRELIREKLVKATQPGDVIFLYWSGHGGQSEDKKSVFLVPYDASMNDEQNTMLYEDAFGRWIQDLDGRKILIILDACYSGGHAHRAKNILANDADEFRFGFRRLAMAKDIGQKDSAVIVSSTSDEVSFVRKEKDLSVMTYFLLKAGEAKTGLTHKDWCDAIREDVKQYAESINKKQTVLMQDEMTEPLIINP